MNKLLRFMKPHKGLLIAAILCVIINNFSVLYLPTIVAKIIDDGALSGDVTQIYKLGILMLTVAMIGGIVYFFSVTLASKAVARFARDIRRAAFVKVQDYSLNDLQKFGTASVVIRCTNDISVIQRSMLMVILQMLPAPIMAIVGVVLALQTEPFMGLLIAGIIVIVFLIAFGIGGRVIPLFRLLQVKMDHMTRVLREIFTGVRVIRAFNREQYENGRFGIAASEYCDISVRTGRIFAILLPTLTLLTNLGIVVILWFGGMETSRGAMEIGQIFALIEYLTIILFTGIMAILVYVELPRAFSCAERLNEVLEHAPEIKDKETTHFPQTNLRAHLEFRNVTFQYPGAEEAVLRDISFLSRPGEITAIIGGTGSGKSTIANLIPRFFDIQGGEILVDGIDVRDYPQKELRDKIGFIPQKAFLFWGTIGSNIRYGKEDATDAEVKHAATVAQAHSFISEKTDQYRSFVAQAGMNLSGGQKQRVAIARALVRKPEIYVFDDSFSALDFKTDAMLRSALRNEVTDATVIIVAQRVSTIMDADQIIVLDKGRAVGIGTHRELMENCSVYQQIAASQLSETELAGGEMK
ncbi:MAG TPA: ABC transporter ATP-binding protein/permease [Firmicutes bacterium]|nr:ABC transporter ATP-binding protein/permease [Bacillota bacterium]